ncbi:TonB-linked SusC/RagA family outer membrane protein [Parabacteroides sp. PF5-5]|uniref:SusC/RagA family TonB-linked outer membrane protein n=1 Tax=unclassified Parabacteroides TaxID=2649774 RepID=UPI00247420A8|nr:MULTISPECIES: TonB-dependent receptor [unclassified Parabacteroides]MDH6303756.1 TonB-linked SusC/RagA family outer membrane protein [Parabacteroides sp. PH5-39]MDH6314373.1 TonB-linked SusC/RagA family outer membrane protein [Parabacteroides sp. PF5-13]MDH6318562.1 TonB-linked SusC/RagA family outer membrane protein [Parabacteroides sp. PH5-13]MDH6322145.1 TonB-linked SusC/RagA family outer membrane protein [Parabacteroides sp. PH5-8]MDH6325775.1 TonB-linked SusC/RagA family outer membrane
MKRKRTSYNAKLILSLIIGLVISFTAFAQQTTSANGHVKDSSGEPIIGASVLVKGTTNGTVTDYDGNFTLQVPVGSTLQVSYIGYKLQEIPFQGQKNLIIILQEDVELLDEVVVIGYGTVKKDDATGSVTAIKPDKMNRGLTTNAQDMIAGKIAGVSVISDGGTPGGGSTIRIRGGSSLSASNDPLIVIDGLAMDNEGVKGLANPLSMVNPNDIETFTVLKDASATAIYGSRASNGVIIITTKKGTAGSKPRVTYDGNVSVSGVRNTLDVMNGDEFRSYVNKLYAGQDDIISKLGTANTDWQDQIYRTSISTDHNINVYGGLNNMPYRFSVGYTNQNGVVKTSDFQRYTVSANISPSFFDNYLKFNINAKYMHAKNRYADNGAIGAAVSFDPTQSVYGSGEMYQKYFGGYWQWDVDGSALNDPTWKRTYNALAPANPLAVLELKDDSSKANSFVGNIEADYKLHFFPDIRLHANLGGDFSKGEQTTNVSPYSASNNYFGYYKFDETTKYNLSLNAYAQYVKDFEWSNLDVMAGYEWQHFHRKGEYNEYGTYPSTNTESPGEKYSPASKIWKTESYLVSFFGRVNYSILNKYLITATLRYDGTSRFNKDNRWGLFPSVALGWKIKEEGFLQDVDVLSDLKLRLGYGITGQQNLNQGDYPYIPTYVKNEEGAYYQFGDEYIGLYRPDAYNQDLKWEETTTYNAGLDFGFLNGRITGSLDYYFRKTDDLINIVDIPAGTNFKNRVISNIGSLENKGFEFSINTKPIVTSDFVWDLGYNLTYNDNEITKLTVGSGEGYYVATGGISSGTGNNAQAHMVGYPASSFYVYQQVYDSNGKPIENLFVDRNGDGIINSDDRYMYKKPTADVLMGLSSKFTYKNFDLGFTLRASFNNYMYNDIQANRANVGVSGIWSTSGFFSNRPKSTIETGFQGIGNYYLSDYYVQNASFLRCDNITFGYSFPTLFGYPVSGRAYVTGQNLFVITKYDGLDPEKNDGIDNNMYPRPMVGLVGVTLNF